jgi:hypothetical protein
MPCKIIAGGKKTQRAKEYFKNVANYNCVGMKIVRISFTWKILGQIGKIIAEIHNKNLFFLLIFKFLKTKVL